jgi:rhodanese-related sulfurtransferase
VVQSISLPELRAGIDDGTLVVLDALGGALYERQHLPGALPLLESDVDSRVAELVPDTATPVVTYCSNPACANSTRVARRLEQLGYTSVRTYPEGIEGWVEAGLPVESGSAVRA